MRVAGVRVVIDRETRLREEQLTKVITDPARTLPEDFRRRASPEGDTPGTGGVHRFGPRYGQTGHSDRGLELPCTGFSRRSTSS